LEDNGLAVGEEVETYICGNPPYYGSVKQDELQKEDMRLLYNPGDKGWKSLDYVAGWFVKACRYMAASPRTDAAFVSTKSICQGEQVPILWPEIYQLGVDIVFAHQSFQWSNLATNKAAVTVVIIGLSKDQARKKIIYESNLDGGVLAREASNINAYLLPGKRVIVYPLSKPLDFRGTMIRGNMPNDGGHLILEADDAYRLLEEAPESDKFIRKLVGSAEFIDGTHRYCLWIDDGELESALSIAGIRARVDAVRQARLNSTGSQANGAVGTPHRFVFAPHRDGTAIVVPRVSSVNRPYLPVGAVSGRTIISDRAIVIYGGNLWDLAILASRLHLCWIATVCVRMRMDYSYSNTLGWNTFPIPKLTAQDKSDLAACAEDILLAREAHFPATIADLYDPNSMPDDLRRAHERNDETLERIYIGRRFRNDTERLEKLFDLYTRTNASDPPPGKKAAPKKPRKTA
jgi:hypothetical protein